MKSKIQVVLAILFISSFIKSFKYQTNGYDIVFIILVAILYLAYEFITEQITKKELSKLKEDVSTKLKQQDEVLDVIKSNTSKMSLGMSYKR
jgi:hypothetical protein